MCQTSSPSHAALSGGSRRPHSVTVRVVDLQEPLRALEDVTEFASTRIFVTSNDRLLGYVDLQNRHNRISATRLREAIADRLHLELLEAYGAPGEPSALATAIARLRQTCWRGHDTSSASGDGHDTLAANIPVSVIIATRDRPQGLRDCLRCLKAQKSPRRLEIVVVDILYIGFETFARMKYRFAEEL